MENNRFIRFYLSAGTYSINDFNTKIREVVLQKKQDWEPPKIKDLKLVIPEHYTFMASKTILIFLVYSTTILKKLHLTSRPYPLAHIKDGLIHQLPQNYYHYTVNISMGNHKVCWPACTFLIIRQFFSNEFSAFRIRHTYISPRF